MEPRLVVDTRCACGEGPLWHPDEQRLYWVDITPGRIYRYSPASGTHELCHEGGPIGGFTIQEDGALLFFMGRGAVKRWKDGELSTIVEEIPEERESRFNDVVADPAGRVFCGTMPHKGRPGRLYRLDPDGSLEVVVEEVAGSNGMGFTPDRRGMYLADSLDHAVFLFDYDERTGSLSNQRVFVSVPEAEGNPDGMTVDAEGYVWLALWDGGCLVRYAPDGTVDRRVHFPARKVTSLTFGGPDFRDAYVTTAGGGNRAQEGEGAGALFVFRPGVGGVPEFRSRVRV